MTDPIYIRLDRTATQWEWTVNHDHNPDDFRWGLSTDYTTACAEALAAYDYIVERRSLK